VADLENAGREKNAPDDEAGEERNEMGARTKKTAQNQGKEAPRRRVGAWIAGVVAVLAIVAIIIYALLQHNRAVPGAAVATSAPVLPPPLPVGSHAPSFAVRSNIGTFSSADLAGKPYLLEIFATWCPHCQRMTKVLRALRAAVPQERLAMISVTGSPYASNATPDNVISENQADVDAFESAFGVTWPTFFDPDLSVAKTWGLNGFPTIFVVNAKGVIVYTSSGEVPEATLMRAVKKAGA
jgi:thiol-disulfide isomerase/thioredoxin